MRKALLLRVTAVIAAVSALAAATIGTASREEDTDGTLIGYFRDASPLEHGSDVRAAGVKVGTVEDIALDHGKARVTIDVDPSVLPLHTDARLKVRPVNLLGEYYIELDPGSSAQPFLPDGVVPVERTSSSVSLQDVLDTVDDPTSTATAAMLASLGEGMDRSGSEAAAAIRGLAPAMNRAGSLGGVLKQQNEVLNQLVDQVQPVAKALASGDGKSLDRLVAGTERMMSTLAANRRALDATLAELPDTLASARKTLRRLADTSDATTPTLASLRPITDDLTKISGELQRFSTAAEPALGSLPRVLDHANGLLRKAAPIVSRLRKAGPDLRATAKGLRSVGDVLLNKHLGDLMAFVTKWSLTTNSRDALGHYFRGIFYFTPTTLKDLATSSPLPKDTGKPAVPKVPLPRPDDPLGAGTATGLTPVQERSMVDQLLGGG